MDILVALVFLVMGFALLVLGADFLVKGASSLARKLSVSAIVIGMTIVAFGTSMPEIVVNVIAAFGKKSDLVFGNVIGSNIMNTVLILGIAGVISPIAVRRRTVLLEIPVLIVSVAVLMLLVNDSVRGSAANGLSRWDAAILLVGYAAFMVYAFRVARIGLEFEEEVRTYATAVTWILIALGITGLIAGGRVIVSNAVYLAERLGVSQRLIGLTIVAIGTSLPELATTGVAAYRRQFDIAVGNVVGSNIFNLMLVLGLSGLVSPMPFDSALNVDLIVLGVSSAALFVFMFSGKAGKLDRWEAAIFLGGYAAYLVFLILRG
jgi:cation:H+ antiporter